ncbi:MAG: YggS family pyridoxal phosphate-dependent enzyme [Chloroflexota bacterium]
MSAGDSETASPDPALVAEFERARARVVENIRSAADRVGRDPDGVRLVAVSKTVPATRVRAAVAAGLTLLGENRVQEAAAKAPFVQGACWHLVGPLQSNKARRAVELFDVVQSVDSRAIADRLDRIAAELRPGDPLPVLLQVNVDDDPAKAGFAPSELADTVGELLDLPHLRIDGLMTIGRLVTDAEEARPTFAA